MPLPPITEPIIAAITEALRQANVDRLSPRQTACRLYRILSATVEAEAANRKSSTQCLEELHLFVTALWAREKQKPVTRKICLQFLLARVPAERAELILAQAIAARIIAPVEGPICQFIPRPKHTHAELS